MESGAGFGTPHPAIAELTRERAPAAREQFEWPGGLPIRMEVYLGDGELPDELVTSVRCVVFVGNSVVVCHNPHETHILPGGRREPGETLVETVQREVREETGRALDPRSIQRLGFLRFTYLRAMPDDHPYPHPDFLQVLCCADATEPEGGVREGWIDEEHWERPELIPLTELSGIEISATQRLVLEAALAARAR